MTARVAVKPPCVAVALAAAFTCAPSAAADDAEPIRIAVKAPAGCPDAEAFTAEVTARTARARLAAAGEQARSFTVTLRAAGKRARGTLVIEDPHGAGGTREVTGETCEEVASALALVTALAIDPRASTAKKPPPPAPPPPPPPPPREKLPPPPPFAPLPWWGPIGGPLPVQPTAAPPGRFRWSVVLRGGGASGVGPGVGPVWSGAVELARIDAGVVAPAFRLSLLQGDSGGVGAGAAPVQARFRWTAGRLEGCPVRLAIAGPLTAYPCALFEAGALGAAGVVAFAPASSTRPWLAPGALGRLQLDVLGGVLVEIEGGVDFPLYRDTYHFNAPPLPSVPAFSVPVAGGFFGAGVGAHFP